MFLSAGTPADRPESISPQLSIDGDAGPTAAAAAAAASSPTTAGGRSMGTPAKSPFSAGDSPDNASSPGFASVEKMRSSTVGLSGQQLAGRLAEAIETPIGSAGVALPAHLARLRLADEEAGVSGESVSGAEDGLTVCILL